MIETKWVEQGFLLTNGDKERYAKSRQKQMVAVVECADVLPLLKQISQEVDCWGPGCPYCDDDTHPFTPSAKLARRLLGMEE